MSFTTASDDVVVGISALTSTTSINAQSTSTATKTMTFFSKSQNQNLLHVTATDWSNQDITPGAWASGGFLYYFWDNNEKAKGIIWGQDQLPHTVTGSNGVLTTSLSVISKGTVAIVETGVPIPNPTSTPASNSTTTTSMPSSGSTNGFEPTPTDFPSTATTSTSSPTKSTAPPPHKSGLAHGAAAGIAIGCIIAGALVIGLLVWLFMKRRKRIAGLSDSEASKVALMHRKIGPAAKTVSTGSATARPTALQATFSQPLEDKAISGEISKISNLIKNHVQSYYHTKSVSPGMIDYDDLQALGNDLPVSVGTLSTLLGNPTTREIALRFCIAWIIISRIQLHDSPNTTFLPLEVSEYLQSISAEEPGSRVQTTHLARRRTITAELMQTAYVRNPFSTNDSRMHNIQEAARVLENVLRPYTDSRMDNGQRSNNLEEILKRAAQFAFTLFSQPSGYDFDWQEYHGVQAGSICIFPALIQTSDENGKPIRPPRPFSEAVVRRLDE